MKAALATLLLAGSALFAGQVNLIWDPSETTGVSYTLYGHTNAISETNYSQSVVRIDTGTNLACRITDLKPGRWWFCATASKDNVESDISNVLLVEVPLPPANHRVVAVQYTHEITNGWTDATFFRLKIQ